MRADIVIGGASGFWGEASHATAQLLQTPKLDFLVYDFLAEITMSIMARARAKDPSLGYATDFVTAALQPNLKAIKARGVRVIANAGGVNPQACAHAVRALAEGLGVEVKVAVIAGDDLMAHAATFAAEGVTEMFSGAAFPAAETIASINAYLGAFPIAAALDEGADIIITGRCVDSALALGACIHSFGWEPSDFDKLSAGSLVGHLLECGPQATGGNFTDWEEAGDIAEIGYPLAEVTPDGRATLFKPEGTAGTVTPLSVGEQMLYEIGDPRAYRLPDVTCDFAGVQLESVGIDRVQISGAAGRAPSRTYKASATYADGFRAGMVTQFNGFDAPRKAHRFADAALARARNILHAMNAPDFDEVSIEVMGGDTGAAPGYGEVACAIAARHRDARAIGLLLREITGLFLATPAGASVFTGAGRPKPSPVVRLFSMLVDKDRVPITIDLGDGPQPFTPPDVSFDSAEPQQTAPEPPELGAETETVPLIRLAVARSGDKGDKANIGVMARQPDYLPFIWAALSEAAIAERFAAYAPGAIERFHLPGSHAMNILIDAVLGGGGIASLRMDSQAKGYGQKLLAHPIPIPKGLLDA